MSCAFSRGLTGLALVLATIPAGAQVAPDAGQVLQQLAPSALPLPRTGNGITIVTPPNPPTLPGGATVQVASVRFVGNTLLSDAQLHATLGPAEGRTYDLAGLRALAERISSAYHQGGYPFARAYLPAQDLGRGQLTIEIVEGRFGQVQTTGDQQLAPLALRFLSALHPGAPIASSQLERATLILADQPGIQTTPVIRPGKAFGTGDLDIDVQRTQRVKGEVGYDNHGNRYTGEHRLSANLQINSPFTLGDQVLVRGLVSDEGLWLGNVSYSRPVATDGWRANVGYTHTYYLLGKDFAATAASGTADVYNAGATYPMIRSQALNLTGGVSYQYKALHDIKAVAGIDSRKSSGSIPVTLQFDRRDGLGGGGITYGSATMTTGQLNLSDEAADASSGLNTRGRFTKWNLDLARLQATPWERLSLYGRLIAQWAGKNLDASERMSLGGPAGVRAYPVGEGFGDSGWLAQIELRYQVGAFIPYAFYDAGGVRINAKPEMLTPAPSSNARSIAGTGLGTRYQEGPWNIDLAVSWRVHGGAPESDTVARAPRGWLTTTYQF